MLLSWFDYFTASCTSLIFSIDLCRCSRIISILYDRNQSTVFRYLFSTCGCVHMNTYIAWQYVILHDHKFHPRKLTWNLKKEPDFFVNEKWSSCNRWSTQPSFFWGLVSPCVWKLPVQAAAEHYPGMRWRRTDLGRIEWSKKTRALNIHMDIWAVYIYIFNYIHFLFNIIKYLYIYTCLKGDVFFSKTRVFEGSCEIWRVW